VDSTGKDRFPRQLLNNLLLPVTILEQYEIQLFEIILK